MKRIMESDDICKLIWGAAGDIAEKWNFGFLGAEFFGYEAFSLVSFGGFLKGYHCTKKGIPYDFHTETIF